MLKILCDPNKNKYLISPSRIRTSSPKEMGRGEGDLNPTFACTRHCRPLGISTSAHREGPGVERNGMGLPILFWPSLCLAVRILSPVTTSSDLHPDRTEIPSLQPLHSKSNPENATLLSLHASLPHLGGRDGEKRGRKGGRVEEGSLNAEGGKARVNCMGLHGKRNGSAVGCALRMLGKKLQAIKMIDIDKTIAQVSVAKAIFGLGFSIIAVVCLCIIAYVQFNPSVLKGLVTSKKKKKRRRPNTIRRRSSIMSTHGAGFQYDTKNEWTILPFQPPKSDDEGSVSASGGDQRSSRGSEGKTPASSSLRLEIRNQRWLKILDGYAIAYGIRPNDIITVTAEIADDFVNNGISLLSTGDRLWYTRSGSDEKHSDVDEKKSFDAPDAELRLNNRRIAVASPASTGARNSSAGSGNVSATDAIQAEAERLMTDNEKP
ncbi:hypothetical protein AAMO2058_000643400 [Amorphochlora amoebiformis]